MKRSLLTVLLTLSLPVLAAAQSHGSYFFENSLLRNKLNAAFAPQVTYISVPVVGSASVDAASNVGLKHFLFPYRRNTELFLSTNISADTFLNQLPKRDPYLAERMETDLLGGGMPWGEHGYATVSLSVVQTGSALVSNELLRFAKLGRTADTHEWDIPGSVQLRLNGYASLAAGYSHDLGGLVEGLRVGARAKLLIGLVAADLRLDRLSVRLEDDDFSIQTAGGGNLSGIGYTASDGFSWNGIGLRGIGAAIDLGVSYQLPLDGFFDRLDFSASANDLGFLAFNRKLTRLSADKSFSFKGFDHILSGDLQEQIARLTSQMEDLTHLDPTAGSTFAQLLSPSFYAGASALFLDARMHVGLLYYHTVGHDNLMASYGASPFEWLNLGVNWTFLGPASRFGFFAEFIPKKYVGVFFGMERAAWRRNSSHLPVDNCTDSFSFGLNILFGN